MAEELASLGEVDPQRGKAALAVFDWSQRAAETWLASNTADRRQILDAACLNRQVTDVTLVTTKRKPFVFLAERLDLKDSRGNCRSFEPLLTACIDATLSPTAESLVATRVLRLSA